MTRNLFKVIPVVFMVLVIGGGVYAQDNPIRELGIRLSGLEDFDFIYKKEKREDTYFRHRLGLVNFEASGNSKATLWSFGLGYAFGIENRKSINEKLEFIHGFEPRVAVSYGSSGSQNNSWSYQLGIGYVLGFQYDFAKSFYINMETIPAVTFRRNSASGSDNDNYNFNAGFSSNALAVTLAYRF